jgi:hypothetical protein
MWCKQNSWTGTESPSLSARTSGCRTHLPLLEMQTSILRVYLYSVAASIRNQHRTPLPCMLMNDIERRAVGLCFVLRLRVVVHSFVVLLFRNVHSSLVLLLSIRLGSLLEASYISGSKVISGGERAGSLVPGCTLWRDNVFES